MKNSINKIYYNNTPEGRARAELDTTILKCLYRWKVATVTLLYLHLARNISFFSFNKRMKKLEAAGLIECEHNPVKNVWLWSLTEKGFSAIRESLGEIKDRGFKSASPVHDYMVLLFQLGPWLFVDDIKPIFFTDQELLKYDWDVLPRLMKHEIRRRPDGITFVPRNRVFVPFAIEVELHAKNLARYADILTHYDFSNEVSKVIWLYDDPFIVDQIKNAKAKFHCGRRNEHLFVSTGEFQKSLNEAQLTDENFNNVGTLEKIMRGQTDNMHGVNTGTNHPLKDGIDIFHGRKFLYKINS